MAATRSFLIHVLIPEFAPEADPQDPYWEEFFLNPGSTVPERVLPAEQQKLLPSEEFQKWGHFWCDQEDWFCGILKKKGVMAVTMVTVVDMPYTLYGGVVFKDPLL